MARYDWGGGGDLSGIFSSLANQFESRVRSATNQELANAKREQDVQDQETYDQWKNGLITDEQWLAYLKQRVDSTASDVDKTDHENFVKMLREHTQSISDNQMEQAYSEGSASIYKIIAYYQGRMESVNKNSPEYRDLSQRYFQLVDSRDSNDIYDGAQAIIDRIQRGQGSYSELLSFYKNRLKGVRSSSDLYQQLKREINSVQDIVDGVTGGSGGSGGSGGGSRRRGSSGISGQQAAQINALIASRAKNGSLLWPEGTDPIGSITKYVEDGKASSYIDALKADTRRIEDMVQQYEDNPNIGYVTDMLTGEKYQATPDFIHNLDGMYVRTEDQIWAINWQAGDWDKATQALGYASNYITSHTQKHNSTLIKPAWDQLANHAFAAIQAAGATADPSARIRVYREAAQALKKFIDNTSYNVTDKARNLVASENADNGTVGGKNQARSKKTIDMLPDKQLQQQLEFASKFADVLLSGETDPASLEQTLSELIDQRPDGFYATQADLERMIVGKASTDPEKSAPGILDAYAANLGLQEGTWEFVAQGNTVQPVPIEQISQMAQAIGKGGGQLVPVLENVAGRNAIVYRATETSQGYHVYVDKDGQLVKSSTLQMLGPDKVAAMLNTNQMSIQTISEWQTLTTSDGTVWYQDPATKLWYRNSPPLRVKTDATGTVMVDENGQLKYDVLPHASESGVVAPYAGMRPEDAQSLVEFAVDSGAIDLSQVWSRDENGQATFEHPDIQGSYWSPEDDVVKANSPEFMNDVMRKYDVSKRNDPSFGCGLGFDVANDVEQLRIGRDQASPTDR